MCLIAHEVSCRNNVFVCPLLLGFCQTELGFDKLGWGSISCHGDLPFHSVPMLLSWAGECLAAASAFVYTCRTGYLCSSVLFSLSKEPNVLSFWL